MYTLSIRKRKKRGDIEDIAAMVMFFFVTAVIWQTFLFNQRTANMKEDIDITINQYLLCVEADGYLSDANKAALQSDLTSLGMTAIDFSGTDLSTAPKIYGQRVTLQVSGQLEIPVFQVSWLRLEKVTTPINIREKRTSISHGIS